MTRFGRHDSARPDAAAEAVYQRVEDHEVRGRVLGGFAWSIMNAAVGQVGRIVTGVILVRLLSPHDYGLAGMALLFQSLVLMISDVSMGAGLIQRREITEADRSTVFWTSAAIGSLLTLSGVALSWPLADFYGQPAVQPLFAAVSVSFVLVALQTTQHSLMQREMQFRLINLRLTVSFVFSSVVGIAAALMGAHAWAVIAQQLALSGSGTLFLWTCSAWRPRFVFSWRSLHDLGGFGIRLFGANVLTYVKSNADNVLVGRFLGSSALGAYTVAYNLMFVPAGRLIVPIQETLFPAFARWQDDLQRLGSVWLRMLRVVAAALVPAMLGFIVVAPDFVEVVLGHKWRAAVPVLQLLAVVGLAQALALLGQRVLAAADRTRLLLRFSILDATLSVAAFAVGLQWGIVGVSICYLAVSVPLQVVYLGLTAWAVNSSLRAVVRTLTGVTVSTGVMVAACLGLRTMLVSAHVAAIARLGLVSALGIAIYAAACFVAQPEVLREVRNVRSLRRADEAVAMTA